MFGASFAPRTPVRGGILLHSFQLDSRERVAKNAPNFSEGRCIVAVNPDKLNAFMGRAVGDIGAALSANMVLLGDKLGLYKAMAKPGPVTPAELAKTTRTTEWYVREWLGNQAAGGYVTYDAGAGRYRLPEEQAMALADEGRP
jgi:hypothetical protein